MKTDEKKRGPKPDILKIQGDWRVAMKKALEKKPPKKSWPKPKKAGKPR
jgi:hypothetical protein